MVDCTTGAIGGNELLMALNANTTRAVASYSLVLDLNAEAPGSCVGVTDGGLNEGGASGGGTGPGGAPPNGGTPPTGTPPNGGTPPPGAPPY